jgi:6-phosphogluconolactonase
MRPLTLLIGTYTDPAYHGTGQGIHTATLDENGILHPGPIHPTDPNPSFLIRHPTGRAIYAVHELKTWRGSFGGAISAHAINEDLTLTHLGTVPTHGTDPCHLAIAPDAQHIIVANYSSGHVTVLPIREDLSLARPSQLLAHEGHSIHSTRQTAPHPHHIAFEGPHVHVTDLGLDAILTYRFDGALTLAHTTPISPGRGPRQRITAQGTPYVLNELTATITQLPAGPEISMLPEGYEGPKSGAELAPHPSRPLLYASNRGHDSIARFSLSPLTLLDTTPSGGTSPRHFTLTPDALIACNQTSNTITAFALDPQTGVPTQTSSLAIGSPVCALLLK